MGNTSLICVVFIAVVVAAFASDMMRKAIVFDKKTPNVFYCSQQKPKEGSDKLFVHARPLSKLCEFDGKPPPKGYKSDCYHDLDETEYACKEKRRIMKRLPKKSMEKLLQNDGMKQNNIEK